MGVVVGKHLLYFALQPPPEAAVQALRAIEPVRQARGLGGKPLAASRVEVVLNPVGAFARPPGPVTAKAREAAEAVAVRRFKVAFDRVESETDSGSPWPLALGGGAGLEDVEVLYAIIHKALVRSGMAPRRQPDFTPGMVLLRDPVQVRETAIEPVGWTVHDFVLIYANPAEGRHEVVERFPLMD